MTIQELEKMHVVSCGLRGFRMSALSLHTVNPNPRQAQGMLALPFI